LILKYAVEKLQEFLDVEDKLVDAMVAEDLVIYYIIFLLNILFI